uniref:Uncharacterized protein n=1 Tax=Anguilla anguilla TaxID=7936 RepID=A0A0E9W0I6_ANGAN
MCIANFCLVDALNSVK